jgi:Uncharacterized protein conserved in bacteria (DUF2147)
LQSLCSLEIATASVADTSIPQASVQIVAQQQTSSIEGIWQAQDKYRIQISQDNNTYNGKIVWIAPGKEAKDVKNPDRNLRSR